MKTILYAEHTKREGYCIDCIKIHNLSIHQLAKDRETCPMCCSLVHNRINGGRR
jgi:hypothetical protein